jgi:hypothetical protein
MIQKSRHILRIIFLLALMLAGSDAMAGTNGGTVVYSPVAQSIPTLSGAMLMVLAVLCAVVAFRVLRAHSAGKPLASIAAAGIVALAAATEGGLVRSSQATPVVNIVTMSPGGGTFDSFQLWGGDYIDNELRNNTGRPQQIISVTPYPGGPGNSPPAQVVVTPNNSPQCVAGLVVQNNSSCYVRFGNALSG